MIRIGRELGVAVGLISAPVLFVPAIKLLLGYCYFEEGCGEYETIKLFAAFAGSCAAGFCIGWIVYRAARFFQNRRIGE